ncbi:hypothetical protein CG747_43630 [Streptomyces sp. CB02959]|uniref:hypothetical protein n=1 Tax=Streptomyces sp. CB02959 TaxID=2020330 RepID=UPI000C276B25|nr:hypothetical protein [Streptomyces sp. CB02959]PJN32233.1 hypothetical protein CG747_43630 [Streptomyces sp. CB02959]
MGEKSSLAEVVDLAEQLHRRPSERDFESPPITVRDQSESSSAEQRTAAAGEVLRAVIRRIGPPTLYGGAAAGLAVRWRSEEQTVLLDCGIRGLRLSVWHTVELEAREEACSKQGECVDPSSYYGRLPYLWLLYRGVGSPPLTLPAVETAPDWH